MGDHLLTTQTDNLCFEMEEKSGIKLLFTLSFTSAATYPPPKFHTRELLHYHLPFYFVSVVNSEMNQPTGIDCMVLTCLACICRMCHQVDRSVLYFESACCLSYPTLDFMSTCLYSALLFPVFVLHAVNREKIYYKV